MLANTRQSYGLVAQVLHWLTASLIMTLLVLGIYMHELPINTPAEVDVKIWLYSLHKTLGILAFVTAIIRVGWVFAQVQPHPLNVERKFETLLAGVIHWLLYGSIILMPITGWLHHASLEGFAPIWWPFSQDLPFVAKDVNLAKFFGTAHKFTAITLIGSLVFHILGAMKHVFVDRDQTLSRILPWKQVKIKQRLIEAPNKSSSRFIAGGIFVLLIIGIFTNQALLNKTTITAQENVVNPSSGWVVDHAKSSLNIEIIQGGKPVAGSFPKWQADIVFDPDALDETSVKVSVEIASLILGGITDQALKKEFLNVLEFPNAVFSAKQFTQIEEGKYQAEGELTIVGKTKPLTLLFDLKIKEGRAFMKSTVEVQRLDYDIGRKGFVTDGILGFTVKVDVELEAESSS